MKRHRTPEIGQHCFEVYTLGLEFSVERLAGAPHLPCNEVYAGVPGVQNRHQQIICRRLRRALLPAGARTDHCVGIERAAGYRRDWLRRLDVDQGHTTEHRDDERSGTAAAVVAGAITMKAIVYRKMRIVVVSDVHGNWTAFQAVLNDMKSVGADLVVHGGDLVGSGSRSADVVDLIRDLGWPGVVGNTDEVLWRPEPLEAIAQANPALTTLWQVVFADVAANRLEVGAERTRWLKSVPNQWSDHGMTIVHASPGDCWTSPSPTGNDEEFDRTYGNLDAHVVVYGHVHQPFVRQLPEFVIANSGSVGLPYDGDPRASYLVIDDGRPTIRRVAYDVDAEIKELASNKYPHMSWISAILRTGRFVLPSD